MERNDYLLKPFLISIQLLLQPREFDILSFLADTLGLEYRGVTILQVEDEEIEEDTDAVSTTMTSIMDS